MRRLLYPLAFAASWWFWLVGHVSWLIADTRAEPTDSPWWGYYQTNMLRSSNAQEYVGGEGRLWPWGSRAE